jgi:hypothetical protein
VCRKTAEDRTHDLLREDSRIIVGEGCGAIRPEPQLNIYNIFAEGFAKVKQNSRHKKKHLTHNTMQEVRFSQMQKNQHFFKQWTQVPNRR